MTKKQYYFRIIGTLFCVAVAYSFFRYHPPTRTETVQVSSGKTISVQMDQASKFYEWLGLLFLAFSVLIWRNKLRITGCGPLSVQPTTEQQTVEEYRKGDVRQGDKQKYTLKDIQSVMSNMQEDEFLSLKQKVLDLFRDRHALNLRIISHILGITTHTAKVLLYILMKEGKVRCDGFPKSTLYTLTSTVENLAIDRVKSLIENGHAIYSERRFVRIKHIYELDAVFEADDAMALVEVKFVKNSLTPFVLDNWIRRFIKVAKVFRSENLTCYLTLVVFDATLLPEIKQQIDKFTYDSGEISIRILIFTENELKS